MTNAPLGIERDGESRVLNISVRTGLAHIDAHDVAAPVRGNIEPVRRQIDRAGEVEPVVGIGLAVEVALGSQLEVLFEEPWKRRSSVLRVKLIPLSS
jgi:hypothetical protein